MNVTSLFLQELPIASVTRLPTHAVIDAFRKGPASPDIAAEAAAPWRQPSIFNNDAMQDATPAGDASDVWNPDHPAFVRNMIEKMERPATTLEGTIGRGYEHIPGGAMIFSDMVLRHVQQHPGDALFNVKRIAVAQGSLKTLRDETPGDEGRRGIDSRLALLELSRIHLVASHASRLNQQQIGPLRRALARLDTMTDGAADQSDDVGQRFFADMLKIEIHSRMMEIESYRGNHGEKDKARADLVKHLIALEGPLSESEDEGRRGIASKFFADAAILLMRMNFPKEALRTAHFVTANFVRSAGATKLLDAPEFTSFRTENDTIASSVQEHGLSLARMRAAFYYQHSQSLGHTSIVAGASAIWGFNAGQLLLDGNPTVWPVAGMAAGFTMLATGAMRLYNGWRTEEARQATPETTFDRSLAHDLRRMMFGGLGDATLGAVMAALMHAMSTTGPDIIGEGVKNGSEGYANFFSKPIEWVASEFTNIVNGTTQLSMDSVVNAVKGFFGQNLIFNATLVWGIITSYHYLRYMSGNAERQRRYNELGWKAIPLFLPGAVSMAYILRLVTKGQAGDVEDLFRNILVTAQQFGDKPFGEVAGKLWDNQVVQGVSIAGLVFLERFFEMFTNGLINTPKSSASSDRGRLRRALSKFGKDVKGGHHFLPIVETMIVGISTAIGGLTQVPKSSFNREDMSIFETAIQSATTVFMLLFLTLLISGVLKGKIPFKQSFLRAWRDAAGQPLPRKLHEALVAALDLTERMYAVNRTLRSFTMDLPGAIARTKTTWDTPEGQLVMSAINTFFGNQAAAWTWTDTTGSLWGRNKLHSQWIAATDALRSGKADPFAGLRDYLYTAGQRISMAHLILPTAPEHKILFGAAIFKSATKPDLPQIPNYQTFTDLYELLTEADPAVVTPLEDINKMRRKANSKLPEGTAPLPDLSHDGVVDTLLTYVLHDMMDPAKYGAVKPVVATLAMCRHRGPYAARIDAFFAENGEWLEEVFDIDLSSLEIPTSEDVNRKTRAFVDMVNKIGVDPTSALNWLNPVDPASQAFKNGDYVRNPMDAELLAALRGKVEVLTLEAAEKLFAELDVAREKGQSEHFAPRLRALAAAHAGSPHSEYIREQFDARPWIKGELGIDIENPAWPELRQGRDRALRIKKHIDRSLGDYERDIRFDTATRRPLWQRFKSWFKKKILRKHDEGSAETTPRRYSEGLFAGETTRL